MPDLGVEETQRAVAAAARAYPAWRAKTKERAAVMRRWYDLITGGMASKYRNSGQTCVCANRILVQDRVHDAFADKLAGAVRELEVGPGLQPGVRQGPLINEAAVEKCEEHIADAVSKGARLVVGGKRHPLGGTFFQPTVLADANPQMKIAREEVFGPVAPLFRFDTEEQAIAMANDTEYGLAS